MYDDSFVASTGAVLAGLPPCDDSSMSYGNIPRSIRRLMKVLKSAIKYEDSAINLCTVANTVMCSAFKKSSFYVIILDV
jgi:hypothetical protein